MDNGFEIFIEKSPLCISLAFEGKELDRIKMLSFFKTDDEIFLFSTPTFEASSEEDLRKRLFLEFPDLNVEKFIEEKLVLITDSWVVSPRPKNPVRVYWFKACTEEEIRQHLELDWMFLTFVVTKSTAEKLKNKEVTDIDYRFCIKCNEDCCNYFYSFKERDKGDFKQKVYPKLKEWMEGL